MNPPFTWGGLLASLLLIGACEGLAYRTAARRPGHQSRFVNARVRVAWVQALAEQPGFEMVAVQALRNSHMSATSWASTSALALMASLTLGGATLAAGLGHLAFGSDAHAGRRRTGASAGVVAGHGGGAGGAALLRSSGGGRSAMITAPPDPISFVR